MYLNGISKLQTDMKCLWLLLSAWGKCTETSHFGRSITSQRSGTACVLLLGDVKLQFMTVDRKSKCSNLKSTVTVSSQSHLNRFILAVQFNLLLNITHDIFFPKTDCLSHIVMAFFLFEYNQPENMEFLCVPKPIQKGLL